MSFNPFQPLHPDVSFSSLRHGNGVLRHRLPGQLDVFDKSGILPIGTLSERDVDLFGLDTALDTMRTRKMMQMDVIADKHRLNAARHPEQGFVPALQRPCAERHIDYSERKQDLLGTVLGNATSGDSDKRRLRRDALNRLGDMGSTGDLARIVERLATSGDCDARETRRKALEMLGPDASEDLSRLVMKHATSGDCDARETRRTALTKLNEFGSTRELVGIVEHLATSGDSDARETRRKALEMLGPDAAEDLGRMVMKHATSGDCDARETRRTALAKLAEFGCRNELLRIADKFSSSGDSDAREVRRMALDLL